MKAHARTAISTPHSHQPIHHTYTQANQALTQRPTHTHHIHTSQPNTDTQSNTYTTHTRQSTKHWHTQTYLNMEKIDCSFVPKQLCIEWRIPVGFSDLHQHHPTSHINTSTCTHILHQHSNMHPTSNPTSNINTCNRNDPHLTSLLDHTPCHCNDWQTTQRNEF